MTVSEEFGKWLRDCRIERGLTQQQLADRMFVSPPTISHWETGKRLPDVGTLSRLAQCLGVSADQLIGAMQEPDEPPVVILVDDEKIILTGGLHTLSEALPDSQIYGFSKASEAIRFARSNRVALAFLDIDLGGSSGLQLCRDLLEIDPRINVVYLTAYPAYSLKAWETSASGFLLKPLRVEAVREQLTRLRSPVRGLR